MPKTHTKRDDIVRIVQLHKSGFSSLDISKETGASCRTVQRLVKKFVDGGSHELPVHTHGGGRVPKVSPRTLPVLKRQVECNPTLTARQIKEQNPILLGEASVRTVQRRLHDDLGFHKVVARKKPLVTERQKGNRVKFFNKYKDWGLDEWHKVLWTDEATFKVTDSNPTKVWRRKGSDP